MGELEEIEAIKQLKARYFRTMDTKDWDAMRAVFADDLVADTTEAGGPLVNGGDEFIAFLKQTLSDAVTIHQGHMPEIELTSATTANGIWALQDTVIWPTGRLEGAGHYHETYEKSGSPPNEKWRIKTLRLTRLHSEMK